MKLKNKVAVITGGNSGIGLGIAKEFKAEGALLAIMGRNHQTLDEAKQSLAIRDDNHPTLDKDQQSLAIRDDNHPTLDKAQQHLGQDTLVVQGDVSKMADIDALYQTVMERLGKIDVLVVNAGIASFAPVEQTDEVAFDAMVNTNFKGAFFTIQKAINHLNDGASIILISSAAQSMGLPATSVYTATKAALRSLARTISADLLYKKVRVNVISPGPIDTPIFEKSGIPAENLPQAKQELQRSVALNRFGTPKEVARVGVFLASSDSSYIIGEEINVDGGATNLKIVHAP